MSNLTIIDIARAAGVSTATVGRVIHKSGKVSPKALERVNTAITELGYVPNQMARSLKSQKSELIGIIFLHSPTAPYFKINKSIVSAAHKRGFKLLAMESYSGDGAVEEAVNQFIGMRICGLVLVSHPFVPSYVFQRLRAQNIPVVAVERGYTELGIDSLIVKDHDGIYGAVKKIAEHGHRRIGFIARSLLHQVETNRYNGYISAINDLAIEKDSDLVCLVNNYSYEDGYNAMEKMLALTNPPTAVLATADALISGAMQSLYSRNLRVPDDMSVVGYDNTISEMLSPKVNSVDLALNNIGETVVVLIEERVKDKLRPVEVFDIDTVYVDRGTVKYI